MLQGKRLIRYGLLLLLIAVIAINVRPAAEMAFNVYAQGGAQRKLPIYSVERDDMRMSISFDAAWGEVY